MKKILFAVICILLLGVVPAICNAQVDTKWKVHDPDRPAPPAIDSGTASTQESPGRPPSDAVVLFDGKDLSKWAHKDGSAAKWKVENGYFEVVPKTGEIHTREAFSDCQLHVEFTEPAPPKGEGQDRGNSGVFLQGLYETQVLDSYQSKTYADGQASAIYGQYPPQVNASRPPGQWQTYDIVFTAPRFAQGRLDKPAVVTVFHNGIVVHNADPFWGPTAHRKIDPYTPGTAKGPITLQDHGNPVRYRNVWVRRLQAYDQPEK